MNDSQTIETESKKFEILCGLTLAVFAAILAITDLGAGKYGDDEIIGHNDKSAAYAWYQSKSIKESLTVGQHDTLKVLVESGSIRQEQLPAMKKLLADLEADIARYKKEKKEILLGSAKVGKENWIQDVDGKLGQIVGAKEYDELVEKLGKAGDYFDMAVFFLQLSLVMGAISLVVQIPRMKNIFYGVMALLGAAGLVYSIIAFRAAGAFA
ncbi:MAG: DUF4337 domain-containing protein [Spirochaetia bacterium]|nr:DUF4337 domain-containing protein [Spirochaetia bacterium]